MLASIILISKNEGRMLRRTVDNLLAVRCLTVQEIIVVDDGSTDQSSAFLDENRSRYQIVRCLHTGGLGIAAARNLGAAHATGDVLVFCDAHILVEAGWLDVIIKAMDSEHAQAATPAVTSMRASADFRPTPNMLDIARSAPQHAVHCGKSFANLTQGSWLPVPPAPVEVPVLSGICTVIWREVFEALGAFGSLFRNYGWEEEEFSMRLWMFGYRLIGVPGTCVQHLFRTAAPYTISSIDFHRNLLYLALCHYKQERIDLLLRAMGNVSYSDSLYQELLHTPAVLETREQNRRLRLYGDDWYARKFHLPI